MGRDERRETMLSEHDREAALETAEELLAKLDEARELYEALCRLDDEGMGHAEAYGMGKHLEDSDRRWTANSLYSEIAEYRDKVEAGACPYCGDPKNRCHCEGEEMDAAD
jgi:hypothetical protein